MPNSVSRQILFGGAVALMLSTATTATVFFSADAAYAERGGNGNGNRGNSGDNGNRGNSSSSNSNSNNSNDNNSRGAVASELKNLNAAHASQNALERANADSFLGMFFAYQTEQQALADAPVETDEDTPLDAIEEGALAVLTGGRELSEAALGKLNGLLGLD